MPQITILCGAILIALGVIGWLPHHAKTALIPAYVGLPLAILGALSLAMPALRKHFMHFAAIFALLGVILPIGGLVARFRQASALGIMINVAMLVTSAVLLALYIRSFKAARRARLSGVAGV